VYVDMDRINFSASAYMPTDSSATSPNCLPARGDRSTQNR